VQDKGVDVEAADVEIIPRAEIPLTTDPDYRWYVDVSTDEDSASALFVTEEEAKMFFDPQEPENLVQDLEQVRL